MHMQALIRKLLRKNSEPKQDHEADEQNYFFQIQSMFAHFRVKAKKMISSFGVGFGFLLLLMITILLHRQDSHVSDLSIDENQHTKTILNQLTDINTQLQQLASAPQNSTQFQAALLNVTSDVSMIKKTTFLEQNDIKKISSQIAAMKNDVDSQMQDLKDTMVNNSTKHYLNPNVLPFQVISIDVISEQSFVSIDYTHHMTPLTVGDSIAGWQITAADYDSEQVEFRNDRDQYVKVSLQG